MSLPGFRPASLIAWIAPIGHVVVVGVDGADVLAAAFGLEEAFHDFLALGAGEVAGLACGRSSCSGLAAIASSKPFLRLIAGREPTVPCSSTMLHLPPVSFDQPLAGDLAFVDGVGGDGGQVEDRRSHRWRGRAAPRGSSASLASLSTASQPVATTGARKIASTPWAMKRAERLDLVFLLLLRIGDLQVDAALVGLDLRDLRLGSAPAGFRPDLRETHCHFVLSVGGA